MSSSTFCFSVAETLRCAGLTRQESLFLLIPALVEGLVGLPLLYIKWGKGKMYWLLVLEGIFYTLLAIMDFFIHTQAAGLSAMTAFKIVDIVIGATSFIPLLAYTLFLFLFARSSLLPLLSTRWNRIVSRTLLLSLPVMVAVNEVSAFLGIQYKPITQANGNVVLNVGFPNSAALGPWNILANTSLALVTAYQAIHFCLAFLHFFQKAYRGERMFSTSSERDVRLQSMKGTGWLAIGLKIGAVETVLGFVGFTFTPTIVRRILRVVGRLFILVGVSLSPDAPDTEGFIIFNNSPDASKRSMSQRSTSTRKTGGKRDLRALISQPQTDTFRRLDRDVANDLFANDVDRKVPDLPAQQRRMSQRVTIHFDSAKTPRLEMRFSDFSVPPLSITGSPNQSLYTLGDSSPVVPHIQAPPPARRRGATTGGMDVPTPTMLPYAHSSVGSDSLEAMKQVLPQFPRLPPRVMPVRAQTQPPLTVVIENKAGEELVRKLSKRKPAPLPSPMTLAHAFPPQHVQRFSVRHDSLVMISSPARQDDFVLVSPYIQDDGTIDYEPSTPTSGMSRQSSMLTMSTRRSRGTLSEARTTPLYTPGTAPMFSQVALKGGGPDVRWSTTIVHPASPAKPKQPGGEMRPISGPGFHIEEEDGPAFDLVPPPRLFAARRHDDPDVPHSVRYDSTEVPSSSVNWLEDADQQEPDLEDAMQQMRGVGRLKSFGAVRARPTPAPLQPPRQTSVQLEKLLSPDSSAAPSPIQVRVEDLSSSYGSNGGANLLRADSVDSGVLSADDRADVRANLVRMRSRERMI
ncbi:hypothetical protein EXIGLDRAFT_749778 [Exidia glandulosa HHB12029]|uniref:Uncharacterized protein n=1 Tax=Exidia glandulosa HHB12029 TaxID=1314781 RepID=A0A165HND9_EXIGL|nr:hypothetical protein EXIGLDRAFT_749778 [Exidia glandulosa HHB12029]